MSANDLYENLSEERKELQTAGEMPDWYTTGGWQMFKSKYLYDADSPKGQWERIAATAAKHLKFIGMEEVAKQQFFNLFWNGWLSPSTPVLSNTGTTRGLPVSCSGGYISDDVDSFYKHKRETALLTKNGFGTSGYLGDIRPRGSKINGGGTASGVVPLFKSIVEDMRFISQGNTRRGAWAGYLEVDHGDFDELFDFIFSDPDDANVGWIFTNEFIDKLESEEKDAIRRWQRTMKMRQVYGKGYYAFIDKINANRPQMYIDHDLYVKASNLCSEITLFSDEDHTFTCVLSSMNVAKYDEWKDTDAVYWATIFLDCIAEEFIQRAKDIPGLENAVRFTEKGRALGLGQCGWHTYLQKNMIPYESFDAHMKSNEIAKRIHDESLRASQWMAKTLGEPEWCKGYGLRNTHRIAIAPTKSTALLMGGISEGINPDPAMSYNQTSAGGEIDRINPVLLDLMKSKGVYSRKHVKEIKDALGSVQGVDWLTDEEKEVFKTAFEINQLAHLRQASARARWLDQWQSLNLFFSADEDPEWIAHVHKTAILDPNIEAIYYNYSVAGVVGSKGECSACQ